MDAPEFAPAQLPGNCSFDDFCRSYSRTQAVLIKGCVDVGDSAFGLQHLVGLHERWPQMVQQSFSMETAPDLRPSKRKVRKRNAPEPTAGSILGSDAVRPRRWYASFIVKEPEALRHLLEQVPCAIPPFLPKQEVACQPGSGQGPTLPAKRKRSRGRHLARRERGGAAENRGANTAAEQLVTHSDSVWLFFGQNDAKRPMRGRPEHTDKMKHHGTWHVQVSGSKVWYLRATCELLEAAGVAHDEDEGGTTHTVRCDAGDVLVVNTRLWWHSTKLPSLMTDPNGHRLSLSYARDFVFSAGCTGAASAARAAACTAQSDEEQDADEDDGAQAYSGMGDVNVDGMLAKKRYKKGSVIMMAAEMPQRKKQVCVPAPPNCMVRDSEDGSGEALVAVKDIASGDIFMVLGFESDDEDPERMHMRTFVL